MRLSKRLLRILLLALGGCTALILIIMSLLLATPAGSRFIVWQAGQQLPGLTVGQVQGSVLSGLTLSDIRFNEPDVHLPRLHLNLSTRALLKPELVVEELSLSGLQLSVIASEAAPDKASESPPETAAPLTLPDWLPPLRLRNLTINDTKLNLPGTRIEWRSLTLSAQLVKGHFTLAPFILKQPKIELLSESQPAPSDGPWPLAQLPDISAPLPVTVQRLQVLNLSLLQGDKTHRMNSLALALDWQQQHLQVHRLNIDAPAYARAELTGNYRLQWPYQLSTQAHVLPSQSLVPDKLKLKPVKLNLSGTVDKLALSLTEASLSLSTQGQTDLTDPALPFDVSIGLNSQQLLPLMPEPIAGQLRLAKLNVTVSGDRHNQQLTVSQPFSTYNWGSENAPAHLTLDARHRNKTVHLDNLSIEADAGQKLVTLGTVDYQQGISWQLTSELNQAVLPEPLVPVAGAISGQFVQQGTLDEDQWSVTVTKLDLSGQLEHQPFRLNGSFDLGQRPRWFVNQLQLSAEALNMNLTAAGQLGSQWQIEGALNTNSISDLLAQADGRLKSRFTLTGPPHNPLVTLNATGEQWQMDRLQIADWTLEADYRPLADHQAEARLTLGPSLVDEYSTSGELFISGSRHQHQLNLDLDGDIGAQVIVSGGITQANDWRGELSRADWQLPYETLSLDQPITVTLGRETDIPAHCWQGQFSQWCLQDTLNWPLTRPVELTSRIDYGSWASHWLTDQTLTGKAEFIASLTPGASGPVLALSGSSGEGRWQYRDDDTALEILRWDNGDVSLNAAPEHWRVGLELTQQDRSPIVRANASLTPESRQLDAQLQLSQLALDKFQPVIGTLDKLAGEISANIRAQGPLSSPEVAGNLNLSGAQMRVAATQTEIHQGRLALNFSGRQMDYQGQWHMGDGQAQVSGEAQWQPGDGPWYHNLNVSSRIQGHQLALNVLPELEASLSPDIQLNLDKRLSITGNLTVDKGKLTIDRLPDSAVQVSDDMQITGQTRAERQLLPIDLDVSVTLDQPFVVSAFNFEGAIDGQLKATQSSPDPLQLFGNLDVTRGRYQAYGQDLAVDQGRVQFVGSPSNPVVQISAVRPLKNSDVKAGIRASGPANNLTVNLFSDPVMDQQSILSYILTGRPPGESGPDRSTKDQGLLLAANQGIGLTGGTLGKAFEQVPVFSDVTFDTEASASGQALATVSGYIGDRIFVKYGVGVLESVKELTVRYYLMDKLWLEAISGIDQSVDLYYQFTIDDDNDKSEKPQQ